MSGFSARIRAYALEAHPVRDWLLFLISLLAIASIDLTAYPQTPAVLVYEIFLLTAFGALFHYFYIRSKNKKLL